jgi:hypothetical protein
MARRSLRIALGFLSLVVSWASTESVFGEPSSATQAYLDGVLVSVNLRRMPDAATASLASRSVPLDEFFDGAVWICVLGEDSNEVACFLDHATPVLRSTPRNPLVRAREIFWLPGRTVRELTSWAEIEEAVASGDIILTGDRGIYRVAGLRGGDAAAVRGKWSGEEATWGRIKVILR